MSRLATELGAVQNPLVRYANQIGWKIVSQDEAMILRRGEGGKFFYKELASALKILNPGFVNDENVESIIQKIESIPDTIEGNKEILEWLRGQKSMYDEKEERHRNITLIDFNDSSKNNFFVSEEWSFYGKFGKGNRPDVVFLINGIPVAIIENKNPKAPDAVEKAIKQLRRYEIETPEVLSAAQVFNVTNLFNYFYGVTWNYSRKNIFNWKEEIHDKRVPVTSFETAIKTFFNQERFLKMIKDWILFYVKDDEIQKSILRQHQTRAAEKVLERCADPSKKRGLVWHTQGSGKTFTMITAAKLILESEKVFGQSTVMLVIDRNELEGQLSGWVERILSESGAHKISIQYANSKKRLQELLDSDFRGLIISMIHKFNDIKANSSIRSDFYILIDEAHRSTEGDLGTYLMGALPNATVIGFTGTPIDKTDHGKGTFKTFGKDDPEGYLDKYSIAESIEDGTTLKLRHQLAPNSIRLPAELLEKEFLALAETEGISDINELNRILERAVNLRAFLKSDDRVKKVAQFVANHFKENIQPLGYKAFLVGVDREACALYKEALDKLLPPEIVSAVYTKSANDVVDYPLVAKYQLKDEEEKSVRKTFAKPNQQPQILIVTDKLLTGYDAPILYGMYLDKPMRDHVLLQAISRVNRPYEDDNGIKKPCGMIIDFVGIFNAMNKALAFDSKDVNAVIEDIELLFQRFQTIIENDAQKYLSVTAKGKDKLLEKLVYEELLDKDKREKFVELYKETETLYEILSPDQQLRPYIDDYNKFTELYVIVRNEYGRKTSFISDVAKKTELLVREHAKVEGLEGLGKTFEINSKTLNDLKDSDDSDNKKIINLVKSLAKASNDRGEQEPVLISLAERAEAILDAFEDRQISTVEALEKLEEIAGEKIAAEEEMKNAGLDTNTFSIYWFLRQEKLEKPDQFAKEINGVYERFPNYGSNADEMRQLKAEIYKILLKVVDGSRMIYLTEQLLKLRRK